MAEINFIFYLLDGEKKEFAAPYTCDGSPWERWDTVVDDIIGIEFELGTIDTHGIGDNIFLETNEIDANNRMIALDSIKSVLTNAGFAIGEWKEK